MSNLAVADAPSGALARAEVQIDLAKRVDAAPLQTKPFDYIYLPEAFSPAAYREMMANLPGILSFHGLHHRDAMRADGGSNRQRFHLYPEHIRKLPPEQRAIWSKVSEVLLSKELETAFKKKFKRALENRFGKSIDRLSFYPVPMLIRDLPGYKISIHSDTLSKAITVQFYMPKDASQKHLGTIFHEAKEGEGARRTTQMQFMPASGYAFPVQKSESWHSAAQTSPADGERDSMMLIYYVQDNPVSWVSRRLNRLMKVFKG